MQTSKSNLQAPKVALSFVFQFPFRLYRYKAEASAIILVMTCARLVLQSFEHNIFVTDARYTSTYSYIWFLVGSLFTYKFEAFTYTDYRSLCMFLLSTSIYFDCILHFWIETVIIYPEVLKYLRR